MKIYNLMIDEVLYATPNRNSAILHQSSTLVETHKTLEGAIEAAISYGFDMSNIAKDKLDDSVTSYSSYIREKGRLDEWAEIIENDLMD